ncbi:uncharacterized protein ARMOST_20265 [Armillaria ostoyae]|uniref:DUF6535 domain-containing protein n=1 Tax=Armillaria ostoyae TaxID=47428 RepID=A0A284S6Z7_ARMOS|nr:uncharacterized protein ARMOST_20265 [Armillaria ostoyae]
MPSIDTVPDEDDENLQRLPHNTRGDTGTSDDPAGDSQPEIQQPARTAHSQGKSTRHFFGIPQRGPQVRGNDPFDYEQRFPEDKRYEELSPLARVWRTYLEECGAFDIELLEGWRDGLDVLLVFAGLFSAVVTTFVVQTSQNLQVNYGQVTATLLFELIDVQRAAANGSLVNDVPRSDLTPFSKFHPAISDSLVNGLWFTSLSFSLATALFAVLTKQWIHQYIAVPSGTPRDRCHVRQFRYMGLEQWGVGFIIGLLPVLLSMSLGIFLVGLVLFLAPLQVMIASVVGAITFISFAAYFGSNFLPIMYPSCPYKTPLSHYLFLLYAYITHNDFSSDISSSSSSPSSSMNPKSEPPIRTLRDAEHSAVESNAEEMDVHALAWLFNMSSNPSVKTIVIQSTGILPLTSVESLKQHAKGISEMSNTSALLYSPIEEGRFDRLARAGLCLSNPTYWPQWPEAGQDLLNQEKNRLSPEVYAELLAISSDFIFHSDHLEQVLNLIQAQFTGPAVQRLSLPPIVWGYLLQKLLPLNSHSWDSISSLIQPLFSEISSSYWHADYKPLPIFLGRESRDQLKIFSPSDGYSRYSGPFRLAIAVREYLSPYVADAIFQYFRDVWDIDFHSDPADEFPAPQDPRLRALVAMASSPSIQKVPMANPFGDSFFGTVMSNIRTYMDVRKSLLDNNFPSFELDSNRYSVLKLLYTLITSDEFGGASMRNLDQRITLVTFLWVLHSTSPRPCFLPEDWCTPSMASNFAQIALQDTKTWTSEDKESDELILYFLWFAPVVNLIFSHFVSGCHLNRIGGLRGDDIEFDRLWPQILHTFIVRMTPDVLDHQVFQQFMAYIFEPENLFTICAVYICREATPYLRRLAQVHPDHPAWPECLRKLDATPLAEHFGLETYGLDYHTRCFQQIISEFKEFVEGGCVGRFGLHTPDPQPPRHALVENEHPVNERSLMKSLPKLWHRLRQQHTAAKTEEIMMNPSSISEV